MHFPRLTALLASLALSPAIFAQESEQSAVFLDKAREAHGSLGQKAASFLLSFMPARDRETLSTEFLMENLNLAIEARSKFPWARALPEERFFNDVLPYAVLDETRESWRKTLLPT